MKDAQATTTAPANDGPYYVALRGHGYGVFLNAVSCYPGDVDYTKSVAVRDQLNEAFAIGYAACAAINGTPATQS